MATSDILNDPETKVLHVTRLRAIEDAIRTLVPTSTAHERTAHHVAGLAITVLLAAVPDSTGLESEVSMLLEDAVHDLMALDLMGREMIVLVSTVRAVEGLDRTDRAIMSLAEPLAGTTYL